MPYVANVQEILDKLHQDLIGKKIDYPHRMIRESYTLSNFLPKTKDEADSILTEYFAYHYTRSLNFNGKMPADIAYSEMRQLLEKQKGGYVQAIKNCVTGRDGGIVEVINLIAEELRKMAVFKYINYIVGIHINKLDFDYRVKLMSQYLSQYGQHILPGEKMMSAYELAGNAEMLVKYHANIVCNFRKLLQ